MHLIAEAGGFRGAGDWCGPACGGFAAGGLRADHPPPDGNL